MDIPNNYSICDIRTSKDLMEEPYQDIKKEMLLLHFKIQ